MCVYHIQAQVIDLQMKIKENEIHHTHDTFIREKLTDNSNKLMLENTKLEQELEDLKKQLQAVSIDPPRSHSLCCLSNSSAVNFVIKSKLSIVKILYDLCVTSRSETCAN